MVGSQRPPNSYLPSEVADDSIGRDVVELAAQAGLILDDWQVWALRNSMGVQPDGLWAAYESALLVSRQNGKGSILEARQLAGLVYLEEPLAVHTAHEFKTAQEHFLRMQELVEANRDIERKVKRIRTGQGTEAIEMKNGCRLRFVARSGKSGRGWSGGVIYLDEAFALTQKEIGALLYSMSAQPNPQLWYMSSAAHRDSEYLHALASRIREGEPGQRLFGADWGAPEDEFSSGMSTAQLTEKARDKKFWYMTNPALGVRISEHQVQVELDVALSDPDKGIWEFLRERLGVHEQAALVNVVVPLSQWDALENLDSSIESNHTFAVDVSEDRQWASIAVAGLTAGGLCHVELVDRRPGTGWLIEAMVALQDVWNLPFRIDKSGPAGSLLPELEAERVKVEQLSSEDLAKSTGAFLDAVLPVPPDPETGEGGQDATLMHPGIRSIRKALEGAKLMDVSDGRRWSRNRSIGPIDALTAATLAVGGVPKKKKVKVRVAVG